MTQWLIEEAAFLALEVEEANIASGATAEKQAGEQLLDRHAEMTAIRERMKHGVQ